jgi:hypothetical protein
LPHAVFLDLEITGLQARHVMTLLVGDYDGHQNLPDLNLDRSRGEYGLGLLRGDSGAQNKSQDCGAEPTELEFASQQPVTSSDSQGNTLGG